MAKKTRTSRIYLVKFDTDKFSQRQLGFLGKIACGFLSPLHDQCVNKKIKEDPHYFAVLQYKDPVTNKECRESLSEIRYKILSIRSVSDLQTGTVRACHIKGKLGRGSQYDHKKLQWFGSKKNKPDERYWFYYHIYTKFGLKKYRGWTDKCLKVLPKPTDEKQNPYYSQQSSPAWNEFVIADLEAKDPVKSILAKKSSPDYQKKQKSARVKAQNTRKNNMMNAGGAYGKSLIEYVHHHSGKLSSEQIKLAMVLQKLTVLNHIAKTLADDRNWGSQAWLAKKLRDTYDTSEIYDLKNKVEQVLFHYFDDVTTIRGYVPEDADKIWVDFCDFHNEERGWSGVGPLDFFYSDPLEFINCPHCHVRASNMYYACYNFDVRLNDDLVFNYHCPYPVGKFYFGPILKLERVEQMPNEASPFLFGHESSMDEDEYAVSHDLMKDVESWVSQFDLSKFGQQVVNEPDHYEQWVKELRAEVAAAQERERQRKEKYQHEADLANQYLDEHPDIKSDFVSDVVNKIYQHWTGKHLARRKIDRWINLELDDFMKTTLSDLDGELRNGIYHVLKPSRLHKMIRKQVKQMREEKAD